MFWPSAAPPGSSLGSSDSKTRICAWLYILDSPTAEVSDSPAAGRRRISTGLTPCCTNAIESCFAPVLPLRIVPLYVLLESDVQLGFVLPVPPLAGVGPPIALPSLVGVTPKLRHAGFPPSQPAVVVGTRIVPRRACATVLAPLANWSRTMSPAARIDEWNVRDAVLARKRLWFVCTRPLKSNAGPGKKLKSLSENTPN